MLTAWTERLLPSLRIRLQLPANMPIYMAQITAGIAIALIAAACFVHPVPNDFDRYMYEAIVRSRSQPLELYYSDIRRENRRAEESSVIDTAGHMKELEPFYAVRPLYIALIYCLSRSGLSIQHAINLISSLSFFGTGIVVVLWTQEPLLSVLLMFSWQILYLGRMGTPDGLSTFLILTSLWIVEKSRNLALVLLIVGLFIRTDSVLLLLVLVVWLASRQLLRITAAIVISLIAIMVVVGINHWVHYPGWIILFRFSFIGGIVSQIPHALSVREYLVAFSNGARSILVQIAPWGLLGVVAWRRSRNPLLNIGGVAAALHFVLFPSPEVRYLLWCCLLVGVLFIRSLQPHSPAPAQSQSP
jgi:hypothetical protein